MPPRLSLPPTIGSHSPSRTRNLHHRLPPLPSTTASHANPLSIRRYTHPSYESHNAQSPTPPKLPPRRRPVFQSVGFGMRSPPSVATSGTTRGGTLDGGTVTSRPVGGGVGGGVGVGSGGVQPLHPVGGNGARSEWGSKVGKDIEDRVDGEESEANYTPPSATLHHALTSPLPLTYSPHPLPSAFPPFSPLSSPTPAHAPLQIAYETYGTLSSARDNVILLHTGLSASSHVASGGNGVDDETRNRKGWWEDFVGPGKSIDTDRFFVICTNVIGGCFGSTGPSSQWPSGEEGERWATRFPMLSIFDMVRAQLSLLDALKVDTLYASIGSSMGGMQSLALAYLAPDRVGRVASISATGRSGLNGVGMRYAQRSVLMADPNWNRGFYYDGVPPHGGMKLARQIATITYRSGPEWETRFGRRMLSEKIDPVTGARDVGVPSLSPDFLIETYLDHQGERFCLTYDANSMIYLSKAMDLFDMTEEALVALAERFRRYYPDDPNPFPFPLNGDEVEATATTAPSRQAPTSKPTKQPAPFIPTSKSPHLASLSRGLSRLSRIPALVLGVQSDVLFPVEQQRELADALKLAGNDKVTYYELGGVWGHDTFLLDVQGVGGAIRGFLH